MTNLPASKAGEAMELSSVLIVKIPVKGRSGYGLVTSAETRAKTLQKYQMSLSRVNEILTDLVRPH